MTKPPGCGAADTTGSGPRLDHDIERSLGHAPQCGEACAGDDLAQPGLTGLCAERGADVLRQGTRRAEQGREAVVGGADRVEVAADVVVGEWLDEHQGPAGREPITGV